MADGINLGVDTAVQSVQDASSLTASSNLLNTISSTTVSLPWEESKISSTFFYSVTIDPNRWDQLFPYRLMVIDSTNNQVVFGSKGQLKASDIKLVVEPGSGGVLASFLAPASPWIFQLPISPQQLSIQDQFAIQTTATLRGVMEEHAGVRFKMINARGTFGVWPQRSGVTKPPGSPGILQSLFGGTIQAAGEVVSSVNNVINIATSNHPANKPTSMRPETSEFGKTSTGYYQAMKMQQFLEQYAEAKKDPANASWRLVFDIPKQNQSFVVTPMQYVWEQNVNRPMEIMFNFQLKAWRRIVLGEVPSSPEQPQPLSPGILQRVLGTIAAARQTLSSVLNLVQAVTSDVEAPLEALRQTALFVKGLAGVVTTVTDLPSQLVQDYKSSIAQSLNVLQTSIKGSVTDPTTIRTLNSIVSHTNTSEGLSMAAVAGGQLGAGAAAAQTLNPSQTPFSQPAAFYTLLDQVPLSSLKLTNAQQNAVSQLVNDANQTTIATLKEFRQTILNLALSLSNSFGSGSSVYNQIFSLPPPTVRTQPITLNEYEILSALYEVIASYDILTATTQLSADTTGNAMDFIAGLAAGTGVSFDTPTSKVLVPVPFGLNIEQISARYLGDPNRWIEIAALNDLREPYVDNTGFRLPLLSNGSGRQIIVSDATNLYIGQIIFISATLQPTTARSITNIQQLSPFEALITVDGLADLDLYTTALNSYVQAYLPGTVNAQQKIFIPSNLPVPDIFNVIPPSSTSGDPLTGLSKVDWLLQENGDLALSGYGDFLYSYGLTNIIQALKIKFATVQGTMITHPDFGLNVSVGSSVAEVNIQELFNNISKMILQDPRFSGIQTLQIVQNGPVVGINVGVTLPGVSGVFPVSFALTSP